MSLVPFKLDNSTYRKLNDEWRLGLDMLWLIMQKEIEFIEVSQRAKQAWRQKFSE